MGSTYVTPNDYLVAESNGISEEVVSRRVYSGGWSVQRAITEVVSTRRTTAEVDKVWSAWRNTAKKNGVSRELFRSRCQRGWSEEDAATVEAGKRRTGSEFTEEEKQIAKKNGLDANYLSIVRGRIRLGWSREDALNTKVLTMEQRAERIAAGTREYHKGVAREFIQN